MDQNISRLNIQLAPRLHSDLETFLTRLTVLQLRVMTQSRISWDDMRLYTGGVLFLIGQSVFGGEFDCKEVKEALLSMSAGSNEITDWRSEWLCWC